MAAFVFEGADAAVAEEKSFLGMEHEALPPEKMTSYIAAIEDPAAVQVLAYEIRRAWREGRGDRLVEPPRDLATAEALEGFHAHLTQTLLDLGFADPIQSRRLLTRLRRLFNRARLDWVELNILRGILSAAQGRKSAGRITADGSHGENHA